MAALPHYHDWRAPEPSARPAPASLTIWEGAALAALLALCLLLRVVNLGALPIFFDEGVYTRSAQVVGTLPRSAAAWLISFNYGAPPLFSWIAAPFTRLLSDPLLATRLASALIGTVTLPAIWASGRLLWGRAAGLLAALLYALCPFALFYNRLALLDGLVMACGAGALFFAVRLSQHARTGDAIALGLCLAAGLLTKVFAASMFLLPLLAIAAARAEDRRAVRRLALPAMLLALLPMVALLLTPQGGGMLSAAHAHARVAGSTLGIVAGQLATWGAALWLYLTPPVVALAVLGLCAMRRERIALLMGPWALLGGLPPALIPGAFLAPRYFLYIAVPLLLLAARGLLALVSLTDERPGTGWKPAVPGARRGTGWKPAVPGGALMRSGHDKARNKRLPVCAAWALALLGAALCVTPAAAADLTMIDAPASTPLLSFDRWQYVTGWPSGYALKRVVAYLRRQEAHGPIDVISSIYNPPGDALIVLLGHDTRVTLGNVDFSTLRAHPLGAVRGRHTFLIACRPYGQPLHPDPRRLHLVLHAANADNVGGVNLYEVTNR